MPRFASLCALFCCAALIAAEPTPLDKTLAIQRAMAEAKGYLAAGQPADAVTALETVLPQINGDADFLALLRQAYGDELKRRKLARNPDTIRITELESKLAIINKGDARSDSTAHQNVAKAEPIAAPKIEETPPKKEVDDTLRRAGALFNEARSQPAKFAEAAKLFRTARENGTEFAPEQFAAWSYCRVRVAADTWNKSNRDASATAQAVREIEDALALVPNHAELQSAGRKLIADVGGKASGPKPKTPAPAIVEASWSSLESDNFRVRFQGAAEPARELLARAEQARKAIFARWTTPATTTWNPKCDLVLHPTAAEFANATSLPATATGHALVKTTARQTTDRRIDLRADDPSAADDALPRELTHIVLGDLFPDREPPKWAAIGMAVLATATESERCGRTLARCFHDGELIAVAAFLDLKGPSKPESVTAYYVESASLVEHLVKRKDARTFRVFLMDAQRYGLEKALDRQYGYATLKEFESDWRRAALANGQ